jgi:Protein of unknown function (DUF4254)
MGIDIPTVAAVVGAFRRQLESPGAFGETPAGLFRALLDLHASNLAQWTLEDSARDPLATDAVVANAKRGIDRLNLARHHFVEELDRVIHEGLTQADGAPPVTESPAMAFDRLSVLVIRLHRTEAASRSSTAEGRPYAERLPALREQLASLETALEQLLSDVCEGRRSFLPYQHHKLYRSVEPATPWSAL